MKTRLLLMTLFALTACQSPKPFDGPIAIMPPKSIGDDNCATKICPMVYSPVCVVYENNGRRMQQTFGNDCAVCIAPEFIVSRRQGSCE